MAYEGPHPIPVPSGGTGNTALTQHGVLVGEGTSAVTALAVGTTGQVLTGSTGADPAFAALGTNSGLTAHSLLLGQGNSAFTALGAATNGQIPIGSTGLDPVLATLTAGSNISISNGAGSVTISSSQAQFSSNYTNVNASPYVVTATDYYLSVDTSSTRTIQLPNSPTTSRLFVIKDRTGSAGTNNITLTTVGGVVNIDGATSKALNVNYGSVNILFNGTSYEIW